VDREQTVVGEFEHDHLEQISSRIGTDRQELGRISVGIEVDHDEGLCGGVPDIVVGDAVPASRSGLV
jgi:hypothetical protein